MNVAFEVVSFARCKKGGMRSDAPLGVGDVASALRIARRLSATRDAVWALARSDGEARLVVAIGAVPDEVKDIPPWRD